MNVKLLTFVLCLGCIVAFAADPIPLGTDTAPSQREITREYGISPRFIEWLYGQERGAYKPRRWKDVDTSYDPSKYHDVFDHSGTPPPLGWNAIYLPNRRKLILRNTEAVHATLEKLMIQWKKARFSGEPPSPELLDELRKTVAAPNE